MAEAESSTSSDREGQLQPGLKSRHMTMIALGGIIGAGLFVGSSAVIGTVGPGAVVSYLFAGILVILVMRMLGEMAVANPSVGSFTDYTRSAIGSWAGFTTGGLYWYFWSIVLAIEAVAGAEILQRWIDAPTWLMSLILMALLTGTNLFSVRSYGEFEFWFASIKVAAIIVFILIAAGWLFGIGGGDSPGLTNLTAEGGFAPEGLLTLLSGIAIVIFAFVGAEIVTIAAAESEQPEEAVAGAVRSVVYRVMLFYVLSIFLLVCIVPWTEVPVGESPFIGALDRIGIPGAADVMNAIIVTAVLSCLNSGLYTGSRMLFALAPWRRRQEHARRELTGRPGEGDPGHHHHRLSVDHPGLALARDRVPLPGQLVGSHRAVRLPADRRGQLRMRRQLEQESPEKLKVKMWLYPWLTWFSIVSIVAIIVSMAFVDDEAKRSYLVPSLISLALVVAAAFIRGRREREPSTARGSARAARPGAA